MKRTRVKMLATVDQLSEGNLVNLEATHAEKLIDEGKAVAVDAADWKPPTPISPEEIKVATLQAQSKPPIPFEQGGAKKKARTKS